MTGRIQQHDRASDTEVEPIEAEPLAEPAQPIGYPLTGLALPGTPRLARSGPAAGADPLGGQPIPGEVLTALRRRGGAGQPLPAPISESVGAELGHDLSSVRVHADGEADRIARSVQSVAFSYGSDVYFTAGTYRPNDPAGQHLLAHELAHVAQPAGPGSSGGTVGRADDPAEAAADRTADRVVTALRRRAAEPQPTSESRPAGGVAALRRQHVRTLRRVINYNPFAQQAYMRNRESLLARLIEDFPGIDAKVIEGQIIALENMGFGKKKPAKSDSWSPAEAYRGVKNWLQENYAPAAEVFTGGTQISGDEARFYFVSNFKTFAEVIIDDSKVFKFTNVTEKDLHAEDGFMAAIEKYVQEQGWHEDFSGCHTILMRINNSPCTRCAERLYSWNYRDIFVDFDIQFANMYEKGDNFNKATTKLRSGGITMSLYSVTANLKHLLTEEELATRKAKDNREAIDYSAWTQQYEKSESGMEAEKTG